MASENEIDGLEFEMREDGVEGEGEEGESVDSDSDIEENIKKLTTQQ